MIQAKSHEQFIYELKERGCKAIVLGRYQNNSSKILCQCYECGNEIWTYPTGLLSGHSSGLYRSCAAKLWQSKIKKHSQKKTNLSKNRRSKRKHITTSEYIDLLSKMQIPIRPIEDVINASTNILHLCTKCGNNSVYISPSHAISNHKNGYSNCQRCGGTRFYCGKNDLQTTHPDIANMLEDSSIGYNVTANSHKKCNWICPTCGLVVKGKSIHNVVKSGLACPICSIRGRSYGERFIAAILKYCRIDFSTEHRFPWSGSKRYDIFSCGYVIEIMGLQHYKNCIYHEYRVLTVEDEKRNDELKKDLALSNGLNYIEIDASRSEFSFLVASVSANANFVYFVNSNSDIAFELIDWKIVYKYLNESNAFKALQLWNNGATLSDIETLLNLTHYQAQKIISTLGKLGYCKYECRNPNWKPVICLTTGENFESISAASKKMNVSPSKISEACNYSKGSNYAGRLPDGTMLQWEYVKKQILLIPE